MNQETTPQPTAPAPSGAAGRHPSIAGFEVVAELGRGAHSTVLRVRRSGAAADEPDYALKILDSASPASDLGLRAFRREAALLAAVGHPGLTAIHQIGTTEGRPYLVMDLVDGTPLADVLADRTLTAQQTVALGVDVVGPLAAVHRHGLVHRDLKPDNIMIRPDGRAQLIDFGLVARETADRSDTTVGTLAYSPPEQSGVLRRPVDNRSDLYSLGVVLFECLAGTVPFVADEVGELLRMHAAVAPPDLTVLVPGTPQGLATVIATLLAKDPDDRYPTGEQLAADLDRLAADSRVSIVPGGPRDQADGPVELPLLGRSTELADLAAEWQATSEGAGRGCVIRAGGGAGKSRLAAELVHRVRAQGVPVLHGKAAPDDSVPLAALRAALAGYLRDVDALDPAERTRVHERIRAIAGPAAGILGSLTTGLGELLGEPAGPAGQFGQDQFTLAVAGLLTGLARESGGLLLVLDDLQWLDHGTVRVLGQLATGLAGVPLMVLGTARDDADSAAATDAAITALGRAMRLDLRLAPLDGPGVAELVAALLPGLNAGPDLARTLAVRGHGNPFIVQEYLRAIVDAGLLVPSWGTWLLDGAALDALQLPEEAVGLVLARVRRLSPEVRSLLVTAATCGPRFRPELVAAVARVDLEVVRAAVAQATSRGLTAPAADGEFTFMHDRIREALAADLDPAASAELHQRIAATMEALGCHNAAQVYALAQHYLAGQDGVAGPQAFAACRAAGELALADYAPADAVTFLQHAAGLGGIDDGGFLLLLGEALQQDGRYHQARERLEQALTVERTPIARARILARLAEVHRGNWQTEKAADTIDLGLAELGASLPGSPALMVLSTILTLIAAWLLRLTRRLRGSPGDEQHLRATRLAKLHELGGYVAVLNARPAQIIGHNARLLYWATRVGSGASYVTGQAIFAFCCATLGLRRSSRLAFARAEADPAMATPDVAGYVAIMHGIADLFGYRDNGQLLSSVLEHHGQWLDLGSYSDSQGVLVYEAVSQGRLDEARARLALSQERLALRAAEVTAMIFCEATVCALAGRPAEAAASLRSADQRLIGTTSAGLGLNRIIGEFFVLAEQNEIGAPFDHAVARFDALGMVPAFMTRAYRLAHFPIAMGRLAQYRAATGPDRVARRDAARAAVAVLGKAVKCDSQRARDHIARADLLVLEGAPQKALVVLDGAPPIHRPGAPLLAYESARVRARALQALGGHVEMLDQARMAQAIARDAGWPHRAGWIATEFGVSDRQPGGFGRSRASLHASMTMSRRADRTETGHLSVVGGLDRQRLQALEQVGAAAARVLDPVALARIVLDQTIHILRAGRAFLFLVDETTDQLLPYLGRDAAGADVPELTGYSASLVQRVRATGEPLVVTGTDEGAALGAESVVLHGLRSIMAAPVMLEARLLGVVYLDSQVAKGIFGADDIGILAALTSHIAFSLETARAAQLEISVRTAQRQRHLADALRAALEEMAAAVTPHDVLATLLRWAGKTVACDAAWLLTVQDQTWTRVELHGDGILSTVVDEPAGPAASMRAAAPMIGSPATVPDALRTQLDTAIAWISLPLHTAGTELGLLVLASHRAGSDLTDSIDVAATLAALAVTAYERAGLFAQVQALAVRDELTGIANRRRFFELGERDLSTATRAGRPLIALMVDIDHFKLVNDTYGHPVGDDVIRTVAQRLAANIRGNDLVGRYGGEEFALVLLDATESCDLPERLRACIADEPIPTRAGPLSITISVGMADLGPTDTDLTALLARADHGLYSAKQNGRNCVRSG